MILRLFILLIGFSLAVSGGVSLIAFLNLITTGHGFGNYLVFVTTRLEFILFILGLILIWGSIYMPAINKREDDH